MTTLERVAPFKFEVDTWGYDVAGHTDAVTFMCEERVPVEVHYDYLSEHLHAWDHNRTWLTSITLVYDQRFGPPPAWHALPYVVEQVTERGGGRR